MFGRKVRRQSPQQSSASDHPFKSHEGIFQVQLQAEIGRQDKPARHLFLLAGRGHVLGQRLQHLFFEAQLKELFLIGLANDFDLIKLASTEGLQHPPRMVFNEGEIRHEVGPFSLARPGGVVGPCDRPSPAVSDGVWSGPRERAGSGGIRRPADGYEPVGLWERCRADPGLVHCGSRRRWREAVREHNGSWVCRICAGAGRRSLEPSALSVGGGAACGRWRHKLAKAAGADLRVRYSICIFTKLLDTDSKRKNAQNAKNPVQVCLLRKISPAYAGLSALPPVSELQIHSRSGVSADRRTTGSLPSSRYEHLRPLHAFCG